MGRVSTTTTEFMELKQDIQRVQKATEDHHHLMSEFVSTATEIQKSVTSLQRLVENHDRILLGDGVNEGLYRQSLNVDRLMKTLEAENVVEVTKESKTINFRIKVLIALVIGDVIVRIASPLFAPAIESIIAKVLAFN
jgi:hypothetical protein